MNESYRCGDGSELVAYLYGECDAAQRRAIETHLASCARCSDELQSLGATRQALASWSPPEITLGFRIGGALSGGAPGAAAPAGGPPRRWWQEPLPAWAQLAAAVLIFAAGLGAGSIAREPATPATGQDSAAVSQSVTALERRLAEVERVAVQQGPAPAAQPDAPTLARYVTHDDLTAALARTEAATQQLIARQSLAILSDQNSRSAARFREFENATNQRVDMLANYVALVSAAP